MPNTLALCQAIRDSQPPEQVFRLLYPDLPVEFPPQKPLEAIPSKLPVQLTSFIGREREIAEVKQLLSTSRLLTLTGSGGCGETRLALQVASDLLEQFAHGVWWVELAALVDPGLVPQAVASALGVREEPKRPLLATLATYLQRRQVLIMLDNCEHLVEACAALADSLLRACPKLRILVTSREPLKIAGEVTWRVPSLSVPDPRQQPPVGADLISVLTQYEAVRLFTERAFSSQPGFAVTNQSAPAVAQICQRLDGIPLAIELAAARVRVLAVEQIAARLDDCFRLLTDGSRTTLRRHQTLRAAVDWSYDLLSEGERVLFNQLSVFAGGFTLETAEAICAAGGVESKEVLGLLSRLVDKSMVLAEEGTQGPLRYRLLETLRQYGRERLAASAEEGSVRRRHAGCFLTLAQEAEPELTGPQQAAWLERLETENDNLRAALRWARESGEAEMGLRLGVALWRFWNVRGHLSEGREWLTGFLARSQAAGRTAAQAKALTAAGALAHYQGDIAAARSLYEESLAIRRELGDKQGIAVVLNHLGLVAYHQGDQAAARSLHEESLAIRQQLGDKHGVAYSLGNLGLVAYDQGDYATTRSLYEQSRTVLEELGDERGIAVVLNNLGLVALSQGDHAAARSLFQECLGIRRRLGDREGIAYALEGFAALAAAQAQSERALRLAGAAAALRQAISAPLTPSEEAELERHLKTARQALSQELFAAAWAEGQAMTPEQAIAQALEED